ncbi:hypothetical protein Cni_G24986 [Canna indica]|uniref:Uncharacterized protein n=1 Tax=Canna indica TaxID=4628 RepID=A0AAQ3KWX1_9LILI|nr:hypothetical protein Cni_G24986 [Canna indica]
MDHPLLRGRRLESCLEATSSPPQPKQKMAAVAAGPAEEVAGFVDDDGWLTVAVSAVRARRRLLPGDDGDHRRVGGDHASAAPVALREDSAGEPVGPRHRPTDGLGHVDGLMQLQ